MPHVWLPCAEMPRPDKSGYYLPSSAAVYHLERVMQRGDVAYSSRPDKPGTYCYRNGRAVVTIRPATAWTDSEDGQAVANELEEIRNHAVAAALISETDELPSPGQLARGLLMRFTGRVKADEPGVLRIMAREGIHQGPMVLTRASAPKARLWDRSQAFLWGLRVGVGTRWDVRFPPASGIDYVRRLIDKGAAGMVHAEMTAPEEQAVPQLPCATPFGNIYGVGKIRNTWTFDQVSVALQSGYTLDYVHATAHATRLEPIYAKMADFIEALPHKPLRKGIYRVAWGCLAGGGGIEGRTERAPGATRQSGSRLWWIEKPSPDPWAEQGEEGGGVSCLFRPSHAAAIAGDNHARIQRVLYDCGGDVAQVLLDSVTLTGLSSGDSGPGWAVWKEEARGEFRGHATGNYRFIDGETVVRERAMGKPVDISADRWFADLSKPRDRAWTGNPATDPEATSRPLYLEESSWIDWDSEEGIEADRAPRLRKPLTALPEEVMEQMRARGIEV